jgi:hypothetical protein
MQFVLTKQIAVEADTPEEAAGKDGKTISLSVNARPQPQQQAAVRPMMMPGMVGMPTPPPKAA